MFSVWPASNVRHRMLITSRLLYLITGSSMFWHFQSDKRARDKLNTLPVLILAREVRFTFFSYYIYDSEINQPVEL